jgi:hypothetical protein
MGFSMRAPAIPPWGFPLFVHTVRLLRHYQGGPIGIGIYLTGSYPRKGIALRPAPQPDFLRDAEAFFSSIRAAHPIRTHIGPGTDGAPTLFVNVHPAAENLEVQAPQRGRFVASAKTSTAGPGYHIFLCDLLHEWGRTAGVTFDPPPQDRETGDDTTYFFTRDHHAVKTEFLRWIRSVSEILLEQEDDGDTNVALSMPLDVSYNSAGWLSTPMGPRTREWALVAAQQPEAALDILPWLEPGQGAPYHLGRAMYRIWCDVRWAPPLTDHDKAIHDEVLDALETAHAEAPTLDYPWREWRELLRHNHRQSPFATRIDESAEAVPPTTPLAGYRRSTVTVRHEGGWIIRIPGHLAESVDQEGNWRAFDHHRTIELSSLRVTPKPGNETPSPNDLLRFAKPDGSPLAEFTHQAHRAKGIAFLTRHDDDEGRPFFRLRGFSAVSGQLAICTIEFPDINQRGWALPIWQSVDNPDSAPA